MALIAEVLCDAGSSQRCADTQQRRLIGGRDNNNRALTSRLSQAVEKFAYFTATFTHQRQHSQVGRSAARHHADQRALAYAAAAEDTQPLSSSAGEESVDGADPATQRLANRQTVKGQRRSAVQSTATARSVGTKSIQRLPCPVDHSSQQLVSHRQRWTLAAREDSIAIANAAGLLQRHGQHRAASKADHLAGVDMPAGNRESHSTHPGNTAVLLTPPDCPLLASPAPAIRRPAVLPTG